MALTSTSTTMTMMMRPLGVTMALVLASLSSVEAGYCCTYTASGDGCDCNTLSTSSWCNSNENNCENSCGDWCDAEPTPEPTPLPTPEPTPLPTPLPSPSPTPLPTDIKRYVYDYNCSFETVGDYCGYTMGALVCVRVLVRARVRTCVCAPSRPHACVGCSSWRVCALTPAHVRWLFVMACVGARHATPATHVICDSRRSFTV